MIGWLLDKAFGRTREFSPSGPWLDRITDRGFLLKSGFGKTETRDPKLLQRITILTNDLGPFKEDIFWKFQHPDGDFYYPASADRGASMLSFFQELDGFDNEKVIEAMSCAENGTFVVWDRNAL